MNLTTIFALMLLLVAVMPVLAQDKPKGPTCEEQLAQSTVQAHNLDTDRDQKEQALAREQVQTYMLRQKVAQLEKQIVDMKAMLDPKQKGEEPKK